MLKIRHFLFLCVLIGFSACKSTAPLVDSDFSRSTVAIDSVMSLVPNYVSSLNSISGRGSAAVSEPGNSDRVTLIFEANRELGLITIKNRIGIEGGQLLVDQDSLLIYNKIDKEAQKVSIYDHRLSGINELASVNFLDLLNFTFKAEDVIEVRESQKIFQVKLDNGALVQISRQENVVLNVSQPFSSNAPYSRIEYDGYGEISGFILPRKITIFSKDKDSKVALLIRALEVNPDRINVELEIPSNIKIQRF